jgi:hypothetical protein
MYYADHPHDSADLDREPEPRSNHHDDDEVVVERTPIVADAPHNEENVPPSSNIPSERRPGDRRRIDRMSTGI